jgi:hypothetical protein
MRVASADVIDREASLYICVVRVMFGAGLGFGRDSVGF